MNAYFGNFPKKVLFIKKVQLKICTKTSVICFHFHSWTHYKVYTVTGKQSSVQHITNCAGTPHLLQCIPHSCPNLTNTFQTGHISSLTSSQFDPPPKTCNEFLIFFYIY